jgi:meiotically up-regulated gene 157 (Mug157) protein
MRRLEADRTSQENGMSNVEVTRRAVVMGAMQGAAALAIGAGCGPLRGLTNGNAGLAGMLPEARPKSAERRFASSAVEETIVQTQSRIGDPNLRVLFANCFPNTLDTTVWPGSFEGRPDTHVVTGDIDAMWLRDSSAQVWPYLPLLKRDEKLRELVEGVIRRQGRMIRLDPYANAFLRNVTDKPLSWAVNDKTKHIPGVGERKWEIDSLCYPIRLAHGYWRTAGDTKPFDAAWKETAWTIVRTFREQQRKGGPGPYSFLRESEVSTETAPLGGFGNPAKPVGMIFSMFRPSDDACIFPLFVPANLFAVTSLRQLAELAGKALDDAKLQTECLALAAEVETALRRYGLTSDAKQGSIWAYEVDGYGNASKMDDANAPGLLSLAYLGCCGLDDPLYRRTRAFALSESNPYFFRGKIAEGIGGPHEGLRMIWPMSIMMRAFTAGSGAGSEAEIRQCLRWLRDTTAGTGFMHESFDQDDAAKFTRPWFAWANTLFGELILELAAERPRLLAGTLG